MLISPSFPPVPPAPPPVTPQQATTAASAFVAAQQTARAVETQTARAPAAVGRSDAGRGTQSSTFVGYAFDSDAQTVRTRSYGGQSRGTRVNISV